MQRPLQRHLSSTPLLLCYRPHNVPGRQDISSRERKRFWSKRVHGHRCFLEAFQTSYIIHSSSYIIHRLIFFHPTSAFFPSKECETLSPNILSSLGVWLLLLLHTPRPMSQKYSSNEAKCSNIPRTQFLFSTKLNTICIVFSIKFHWKSKKKSAKSDKYQENEEGSRVKNVCRWGVERFAGAVVPTTNHRHRYPS